MTTGLKTAPRPRGQDPPPIIGGRRSWADYLSVKLFAHHADPTCARHGVLPRQLDSSARIIWTLEKLGWVWQVRWSNPQRLARIAAE